jgi:hypothetical protein
MADQKISALTSASTPLAGTEVLPIVQSGSTVKVPVSSLTAGRAVSTGALSVVGANATLDNAFSLSGKLAAGSPVSMMRRNSSDQVAIDEDGYGAVIGFGGRYNFAGGGDFTVGVGNVVIGTSGKGIDFSANTGKAGMTSELLNWYEEGVWTTGMTADSGTVTLSFDKLNYTRVGRTVSISGEIVVDSIGSPTDDIYISLPFTNSASTAGRSGSWSSYLGIAYTFTGVPLGPMVGLMTGSATKMTIRVGNNSSGTTAAGFLAVGTTFVFGFTYQCQ